MTDAPYAPHLQASDGYEQRRDGFRCAKVAGHQRDNLHSDVRGTPHGSASRLLGPAGAAALTVRRTAHAKGIALEHRYLTAHGRSRPRRRRERRRWCGGGGA
jgi:hypothetical protein